jgi:hypothetical protein
MRRPPRPRVSQVTPRARERMPMIHRRWRLVAAPTTACCFRQGYHRPACPRSSGRARHTRAPSTVAWVCSRR